MIKLLRYMKPYILSVILCAGLIYLQVNLQLALPDYMSKIVNTGIQQGGIETAVPEAVSKATIDKLVYFMTPDEKDAVLSQYTLADKDSGNYSELVKAYPALEKEAVYILNEGAETGNIEPVFAAAFTAVSGIQRMINDPSAAGAAGMLSGSAGAGMPDFSTLPQGTDFFTMLSMMPEQQRDGIISLIESKLTGLDPLMLEQGALIAVKAEYTALGMDVDSLQMDYIKHAGVQMVLFTLISIVANMIAGLLAARAAAGMAQTVRSDTFRKVEQFNGEEFDRFSTASLITRTTNDITQIQMVVFMMLRIVIFAPLMGIGGVMRAFSKAPSMAWLIGLAVLVLLGVISIVMSVALPKFKMIQKLVDKLNLVTREQLSGLMVVRAFNRQKSEEERFDKANRDLTSVNLFIARVMVTMMPFMMLVMNGLTVAVIWVGAHKVAESAMQVGDMMAFLQYAMQIVMSFLMLSMIFIFLPRASVSGVRIAEVLDTEPTIRDPEKPAEFEGPVSGRVEFRNVCFRYPGGEACAVRNISFTAEPGKTTAIIGSTGSGKSTVVNLIPRFYDAEEGEILLDGINVKDLRQKDLRDQIGYVPQKVMLFSGTIKSNLQYGDENADENALVESAATAQASEFIDSKPEGLETKIAQGGQNISGGQKQRLSIARALVKKAPVCIFDDSFSALDFRTDAALRRAMKENMGDSTLIIVAQRVSTIMRADQIIVLDEGEIVGKGTHDELMKDCDEYREIVYSQLSLEELA